jgi:hypothetical protein
VRIFAYFSLRTYVVCIFDWFLLANLWFITCKLATYLVKTGPPMQTWKLLIWATRCWSKGAHRKVGGEICESVIRSGRLSAKLPNPPAPLGSTSCGLDSKFSSLHRWSGFHLIHCPCKANFNLWKTPASNPAQQGSRGIVFEKLLPVHWLKL